MENIWKQVVDFMQQDLVLMDNTFEMWMAFAAGAGLILIVLVIILITTRKKRKTRRYSGFLLPGRGWCRRFPEEPKYPRAFHQ